MSETMTESIKKMTEAIDYEEFCRGVATKPCGLRCMSSLLADASPSLINLAPGFPDPATFPYADLTITLRNGDKLALAGNQLNKAMQYAATEGIIPLLQWLTKFQTSVHNPPFAIQNADSFRLIITNGCTEGLQMLADVLLASGDTVVMEEPTFPSFMTGVMNRGVTIIPVEGDKDGMRPANLRQQLVKADPKPRVLYVVPTGGNPSGATYTLQRKQEIYQIAQEFDLLIIEDDPYYYVTYEEELIPSFLALDVDGRVFRCDSFSKIVAPGLRLGILSGPAYIVGKVRDRLTTMSNSNGPLAQKILSLTLENFGFDGFHDHLKGLGAFYKPKRDAMARSLDKWITGLADWSLPRAGIFFWLKLRNVADSEKLIFTYALKNDVLTVPGCYFMVDKKAPSPYVRVAYSFSSEEQIEEGIQRFATVIKDYLARENN